MKTLYIECRMGAAGDMLASALLELVQDPDRSIERLTELGIPGFEFVKEQSVKCGINGTHLSVLVHGAEEGTAETEHHHEECSAHEHCHDYQHDHSHEHTHDHHEHSHHHSSLQDIRTIVKGFSGIPGKVIDDILGVYSMIAEAESHVHGVPVHDIHFHEVGTMDAVADITAVCLLLNELSPDRIVVSPVHMGYGTVKCAHGILPVPAPATAYILKDVPIFSGDIEGELCTPTGAALLKYFADSFGPMPQMKISAVGYGMGKKDFPAANCVRAMIGGDCEYSDETAIELSCNVDDMTAEDISFAMDRLFESGALEAFTVPIGMKKSRPGTLIRVIFTPEKREDILRALFKHTSTIGVRETVTKRYKMDRRIETVSTVFGNVRVKRSSGFGAERSKYEYDDISRIAIENGLSLAEVREILDKDTD